MKIIKGFQQFVNEDQGRAHTLLRNIERSAHTGDNSHSNAELYKLYTEDPVEYERLIALADRTKDRRFAMRKTGYATRTAANLDKGVARLKNQHGIDKDISLALGNKREMEPFQSPDGKYHPADPAEPWMTDLAKEFRETDMTLDDLVNAVADRIDPTRYPSFSADKFKEAFMRETRLDKINHLTSWSNS